MVGAKVIATVYERASTMALTLGHSMVELSVFLLESSMLTVDLMGLLKDFLSLKSILDFPS